MVLTGVSLNVYSQIGLVLLVGHHRQERHPGRRVRQPAARPRRGRARGDRGGLPHPAAAGDDDDGRDDPRRRAAAALARRRRRGAGRARLGDRRRPRARDGADPVPDAGRLPAARRASRSRAPRRPRGSSASSPRPARRRRCCRRRRRPRRQPRLSNDRQTSALGPKRTAAHRPRDPVAAATPSPHRLAEPVRYPDIALAVDAEAAAAPAGVELLGLARIDWPGSE